MMKNLLALCLTVGITAPAPAAPLNLLLVTADDMNADSTGLLLAHMQATADPQLTAFETLLRSAANR
jgi:hypothetical protein